MIPKLREVLLLDFGVACGAVSSSQAVRQMLAGHGYQTHVVSCWMLLVDDAISAKVVTVVNPLLIPGCFGAAIYQSRCQAKLRALVVAGDKLGWFEAQRSDKL